VTHVLRAYWMVLCRGARCFPFTYRNVVKVKRRLRPTDCFVRNVASFSHDAGVVIGGQAEAEHRRGRSQEPAVTITTVSCRPVLGTNRHCRQSHTAAVKNLYDVAMWAMGFPESEIPR
jgi:hypothetical protein